MKNYLYPLACLFCGMISLNSCKTSNISGQERREAFAGSKETNSTGCFVKFNDGTLKSYKTLRLVTSPFGTPYLLADGKEKIKAAQITEYQNHNHYAISQRIFCDGKITHVATETLPGFAIRIVKGKLNVYCKKYYNGQVAVDEFYLQAGKDAMILSYTPERMNELVKDNTEAYNLFNNKKFKGPLTEKVQATAQLYNSNQLISKN